MITIPEELLFSIIHENLEIIIDSDIHLTYNNIKQLTVTSSIILQQQFEEVNNYCTISENDFFEYFTNGVASTIGRVIQGMFVVGDVAAGTVTSGAGVSGVSSYLITTLTPVLGMGWATAVSGFLPLLVLVAGFAIYKKIKSNDVLNVANMAKHLTKLSEILKSPLNERINTEFKELLQNKCNTISEKNLKIECAINGYVQFLNEFVLVSLVTKYIVYLKSNNENLTGIDSFHQLATFKSQSNSSISDLMNKFYSSYLQFLKGLKINTSVIGDSFRLLNNTVLTALKR